MGAEVVLAIRIRALEAEILEVVRKSEKRRFELSSEDGETWIRAAQGHSMSLVEDSRLLRRLSLEDPDLPVLCVHGTYVRCLESILLAGLLAGGKRGRTTRNHIHFVPSEGCVPRPRRPGSFGLRDDCEVLVWVDLRSAMKDGVPFFLSTNRVVLSPGLDGRLGPEYVLSLEVPSARPRDQPSPGRPGETRKKEGRSPKKEGRTLKK